MEAIEAARAAESTYMTTARRYGNGHTATSAAFRAFIIAEAKAAHVASVRQDAPIKVAS